MTTSAAQADEQRKQASEAGGASIESVEQYDLGLVTSAPTTVDGRTYRRHDWGGHQIEHGVANGALRPDIASLEADRRLIPS